jgi:hypothetical protein
MWFVLSVFLRRVMLADAVATAAAGCVMFGAAGALARPLNLPAGLLSYSGLSLLPFAALVALAATRRRLPRWVVWAVIAYNALWALDSVLLLASGLARPTALGVAFVLAQAAVVAVFAELEYVGLRRSQAGAAEAAGR